MNCEAKNEPNFKVAQASCLSQKSHPHQDGCRAIRAGEAKIIDRQGRFFVEWVAVVNDGQFANASEKIKAGRHLE